MEKVVFCLGNMVYEELGLENFCLVGGVVFNCVVNGCLLWEGKFKNIWI